MKAKALPGRIARTKKVTTTRIGLTLAAVLIALTVGTLVLSRTSTQAQKKKYVATREIVRDQASGMLRKPTAEETDAMVNQIKSLTNRSSEGLSAKQLPNGTKQVTLDGRFSGVVLGVAKEDGTTEIRCVTTMEEAVAFLGLQESSVNQ